MKKQYFRSIATVLAFVIVLSLAAACGGGSSKGGSQSNTQSPQDSAPVADNTVYELVFSQQDPETSIHAKIIQELWGNKIEEASGGRIKIVYGWAGSFSGVPELLDNVENGVLDGCWAATSQFAGRYTAISGMTLPGIGLKVDDNGAEAIWKWLHEEEPQKEIGALYLQAMYLPGDSTIYNSKRELKTVADFSGLRIRTLNPAWTMVLDNLKANPMTFNLPETYENIEKNVADGYVMDYSWSTANRAYEVAPYALDAQLGLNIASIYLSQHFLDKLPDDLRQIFYDFDGLAFAKAANQEISKYQEEVKSAFTLTPISDEIANEISRLSIDARGIWKQQCTDKGYDAESLDARLAALLAQYAK